MLESTIELLTATVERIAAAASGEWYESLFIFDEDVVCRCKGSLGDLVYSPDSLSFSSSLSLSSPMNCLSYNFITGVFCTPFSKGDVDTRKAELLLDSTVEVLIGRITAADPED